MGERGGVQHYLYWSNGRIRRFLEDQGIVISEQTQRKLSSPSFNGYAPTMEAVWTRFVPYKVELAKKVEATLRRLAVSDFDSPAPIKFAHSNGTVTFGEFVTFDRDEEDDRGHPRKALMYASVVTESGLRVGVCPGLRQSH